MKTQTHPFITQRLLEAHLSPEEMDRVCDLLSRQRDACDEVWFATPFGFPPLDAHKASAEKMAAAAGRVRELGIAASLQIANTLGHGEYLAYLDFRGLQWQRMVGHDGQESPLCNCPRAPAFLDYLAASTEMYCAWQPESVWIDDDLRLGYHGRVRYVCFCPQCLADFNAETGAAWTRETLVAALNTDEGIPVRRQWVGFGRQSLARTASVIATAARAAAPECRLGFQHADLVWGAFAGPDHAPVFEALAAASGRGVGSRPGGGFYTDHAPREVFGKVLLAGHQNSRLPACVDDVRYEIENLPATFSGKSAHGTAVEATLALAYGCNAISLTPLSYLHEEDAWHEKMFANLAAWRPFWLRYLEACEGSRAAGATIALGASSMFRKRGPQDADFWWANGNIHEAASIAALGIPLAWDYGNGAARHLPVLLHPSAVDGLTDDELRDLLARNVITSGDALVRLQERNLAGAIPVTAEPLRAPVKQERLTNDPLNSGYAGRHMFHFFFNPKTTITALHPRQDDVRVLAHFEDAAGPVAPATIACTTAQGGRWVVFGKDLFSPTVTTARRQQCMAALDWLSGGCFPVLLDTPCQVIVIPRCDEAGRVASILLLNAGLDASPPLALRVRNPRGDRAVWLRPQEEPLSVSSNNGNLLLPPLAPWHLGVVIFKPQP